MRFNSIENHVFGNKQTTTLQKTKESILTPSEPERNHKSGKTKENQMKKSKSKIKTK